MLPSLNLPTNAIIVDLGCGDGRDSFYLSSQGYKLTAVYISPTVIAKASALASSLPNPPEFLVYDALHLPKPQTQVHLVIDNTIYCNLRLEYLSPFLSMMSRISQPGSFYVLICGSSNAPQVVAGHPRLDREIMLNELSPMFEIISIQPGLYDMHFTEVFCNCTNALVPTAIALYGPSIVSSHISLKLGFKWVGCGIG